MEVRVFLGGGEVKEEEELGFLMRLERM